LEKGDSGITPLSLFCLPEVGAQHVAENSHDPAG
jgi:hypothetical protein